MEWTVEFYRNEDGTCPVEEFMDSLPPKMQAKAMRQIDLLEQFGINLKEPYAKPIKGEKFKGLWELRIKFASDITRVFYFLPTRNTFILLHGFIKKTTKTPKSELETAKNRMEDYLRRRTK